MTQLMMHRSCWQRWQVSSLALANPLLMQIDQGKNNAYEKRYISNVRKCKSHHRRRGFDLSGWNGWITDTACSSICDLDNLDLHLHSQLDHCARYIQRITETLERSPIPMCRRYCVRDWFINRNPSLPFAFFGANFWSHWGLFCRVCEAHFQSSQLRVWATFL